MTLTSSSRLDERVNRTSQLTSARGLLFPPCPKSDQSHKRRIQKSEGKDVELRPLSYGSAPATLSHHWRNTQGKHTSIKRRHISFILTKQKKKQRLKIKIQNDLILDFFHRFQTVTIEDAIFNLAIILLKDKIPKFGYYEVFFPCFYFRVSWRWHSSQVICLPALQHEGHRFEPWMSSPCVLVFVCILFVFFWCQTNCRLLILPPTGVFVHKCYLRDKHLATEKVTI